MKSPWQPMSTAPMGRDILMGRPGFQSWVGQHPYYYETAEGWMEIPNMGCRDCGEEPIGGTPLCGSHSKQAVNV